jgi:hypothetical protein
MSKRKSSTTTVDSVVDGHAPPVREIVERLRAIIREVAPEAVESANPVWHSLSYKHPASGYFCGIFPQADRVDVAFEFGVLLPDSEGVLEGAGKQVRYLRLRAERDLREEAFRRLLIEAINLPPKREAKLALIRERGQRTRAAQCFVGSG